MTEKSTDISTRELWARLFHAPSAGDYLTDSDPYELPDFSAYITELCTGRGEKPERILKRADIESSYGHRLFSGARRPSRDTVLQLAFGLGLDADGAQQLLKVARAAALHPKVKRDAVLAWCLHRHAPLTEAQQILLDNGLPILGSAKNGSD
jgi:hypothetical protein